MSDATQSTAHPQSCERSAEEITLITTKGYEPNSSGMTSTGQCVVCRFPGAEEEFGLPDPTGFLKDGEMRADMMDEEEAARPKKANQTPPPAPNATPRRCRFFLKEAGCAKGGECMFGHDQTELAHGACRNCGATGHKTASCTRPKKSQAQNSGSSSHEGSSCTK